jgi:hypothetical protein
MSTSLSVGYVVATPSISLVRDRYRRRIGVFIGTVIGAIIQGASVHYKLIFCFRILFISFFTDQPPI